MNQVKETYILRDTQSDFIHSKFEVSVRCEAYIEGACYAAVCWTPDKMPIDWAFVADTYCKADACTHWYFFGDDYDPESKSEDNGCSYYHLCGGYSFMDHLTSMCFVWKLMEMLLGENRNYVADSYYDHERIKQVINLVLDGYVIEKVDGRWRWPGSKCADSLPTLVIPMNDDVKGERV